MNRKQFIEAFLGAFGEVVVITTIEPDRISGTVIYQPDDPEEQQEFCWHASETNLPSESTYRLACLIKEQNLLNIDRIVPSRDALRLKYNHRWDRNLTPPEFDCVVDDLEGVKVRMVDDGEETDTYFMHE
jgi:hypothetical protein